MRYVFVLMGFSIPIKTDTTVLSVDGPAHVVTCISAQDGLEQYEAKAIILAMGCRERPRGALGTPGTRCSGIYSAGTAQKFVNLEGFMPGKRIVILGSGDIGLIMARRMTLQGAKGKESFSFSVSIYSLRVIVPHLPFLRSPPR